MISPNLFNFPKYLSSNSTSSIVFISYSSIYEKIFFIDISTSSKVKSVYFCMFYGNTFFIGIIGGISKII